MSRALKSVLSLVGALVVLVVMGVWGTKALFAELPKQTSTTEQCQNVKTTTKVLRREVAVSVYNASDRAGLAGDTMKRLQRLGFRPGATGNAPEGTRVRNVVVWTTTENDPTAELVAAQFKQKAQIVIVDLKYGPGVDIVLGSNFRGLKKNGPRDFPLPEPKVECLD